MTDLEAIIRIKVQEEVSKQMKEAAQHIRAVQDSSRQATQFVRGFFTAFTGPLGAAAAGAALALVAKSSVEAAAQLEEINNKAQAVFGEKFGMARQSAAELGRELGRSKDQMLALETGFDLFAEGVGVGSDAAIGMSEDLARLSVDFSKVRGTQEEAAHAIEMALVGNGRALRQYGVILNDTTLNEYLAAKGSKVRAEDLDAESKAVASYNFLLEKTAAIQEAAAKNTGGLRDVTERLKGSWQDYEQLLGKSMLPFITHVIANAADQMDRLNLKLAEAADARALAEGKAVTADYFSEGSLGTAGKDPFEKNKKSQDDWVSHLRSTSDKGAKEHEKIAESMKGLGDKAQEAYGEVVQSIAHLEAEHQTRMRGFTEDLEEAGRAAQKLADDYGKAMRDIDKSEADTVLDAQEKVGKLEDELSDLLTRRESAAQGSGSVSVGLQNDIEQKSAELEKEKAGLARLKQQAGIGVFTGTAAMDTLNAQAESYGKKVEELKRQQEDFLGRGQSVPVGVTAALETYAKRLEGVIALIGKAKAAAGTGAAAEFEKRRGMTESERRFADDEQKRTDAGKDHQDRLDDQQREIEKLNEKQRIEQETYTRHRQELELTKTAIQAFQTDYEAALRDVDKVTQQVVDDLTKRIEQLRVKIGEFDALVVGNAQATGGGTTATRRQERLDNVPDTFLNSRATGGFTGGFTLTGEYGPEIAYYPQGTYIHDASDTRQILGSGGNVTITIQHADFRTEADARAILRMIAREIQQQKNLPV